MVNHHFATDTQSCESPLCELTEGVRAHKVVNHQFPSYLQRGASPLCELLILRAHGRSAGDKKRCAIPGKHLSTTAMLGTAYRKYTTLGA
eukprot:1354221-Lingulodinium_polyedra.AAC.1